MFTLGNKEIIVNSSDKYPITIDGDTLKIGNYGEFYSSQIHSAIGQRYIPGRVAGMDVHAPSASDLGIAVTDLGVPVVVTIKVTSLRLESMWSTDFIAKSRPLMFEILIDGTDDGTAVADKLVSAMSRYESNYTYADDGLPFTFSTQGTEIIYLGMKTKTLDFYNRVEFIVNNQIYPYVANTDRYIHWTNNVVSNSEFVDTGIRLAADATDATTITVDDASSLAIGDTIQLNGVNAVVTNIVGDDLTLDTAVTGVTGDTVLVLIIYDTVFVLDTLDNLYVGDTISINDSETVITFINNDQTSITVSPAVSGVTSGDAVLIKGDAMESIYDGKYLEENVRMSLKYTSDTYGISPDEKPIITGAYTSISFIATDDNKGSFNNSYVRHNGLGKTRGEEAGNRLAKFTIYFLENTDLFVSNGTVEQLVNWLMSALDMDMTKYNFRIYNRSIVNSGALFIA